MPGVVVHRYQVILVHKWNMLTQPAHALLLCTHTHSDLESGRDVTRFSIAPSFCVLLCRAPSTARGEPSKCREARNSSRRRVLQEQPRHDLLLHLLLLLLPPPLGLLL
ncbi:unnamed protein product, partial [Laminaria digitata]